MPKGKPAERETRMPLDDVEWIRCDICGTHVPASRVLHWCASLAMTEAETDIILRLVAGTPRHRLARALECSENTTKTHLRSLLKKAGAPNVPSLLRRIDLRPSFDRNDAAQ